MSRCRKPGCAYEAAPGLAYCSVHKGGTHANVAVPAPCMAVKVKAALQADREAGLAKAVPLRREAISLAHSPLGAHPLAAFPPRVLVAPGTSAAAQAPQPGMTPDRARAQQTARLQAKLSGVGSRGDSENLKKITQACLAICTTKTFSKYIDDEVGWTNWSAWTNWFFRAAAPAMMQRPVTEEVVGQLERLALDSEMNKKKEFAGRFFFELALYCRAQIEKMDIEFVFSQAAFLFGPLLAPLQAVPGQLAGKAGHVAQLATDAAMKVGNFGVQTGAKKGLQAGLGPTTGGAGSLLSQASGGHSNKPGSGAGPKGAAPKGGAGPSGGAGPGAKVSVAPAATVDVKKYKDLNPMRFSLALWKFCAMEREPGPAIKLVLDEFGGKTRIVQLWDWLEGNNL